MRTAAQYAGVELLPGADGPAMSGPASGRQVRSDTELTFGGDWNHDRLTAPRLSNLDHTLSTTRHPGAGASATFDSCEGLALYGSTDEAKLQIRIDDGQPVVVSGSDAGCLYESTPLAASGHTLFVTVLSGTLSIDRVEASGSPAPTRFVSHANGAHVYAGTGFAVVDSPQARSRSLLRTTRAGEPLEICFRGDSIELLAAAGPDYGTISVRVDGGEPQRVNAQTSSEVVEVLWSTGGLDPERYHVVRLDTEGTFALDGAIVPDAPPLIREMATRRDEELRRMQVHERPVTSPDHWRPISPRTRLPERGVRLGEGPLRRAFDRNIDYLRDSLTMPYWVREKDPDRIWVDMLAASNEGRMLGGMGHTLRFAEVPEFQEAIGTILEPIERRQFMNGDGWILPYTSASYAAMADTWPDIMRGEQRNYDRSMFTKGMLAAARGGFPHAYDMLRSFYDWFSDAEDLLPNLLAGPMGIQGSVASPLMYHSPVGREADLLVSMRYYDMHWWLELLSRSVAEAAWRYPLDRPHNYLLTSIHGFFLTYLATGDERYLAACTGAYRIYRDYFQLPGGGITLCEHHECRPWTYRLNNDPVSVFETCGNVFWVELCSDLLSLDPGNEEYASQMEESILNFILASQAADGTIKYFNQMNGTTYPAGRWNTCCEIQATHFFASMPQYVFSLDDEGVWVNLYTPAEIDHEVAGRVFTLRQDGDVPSSPEVRLEMRCPQPVSMTVRIRVPSWSDGPVPISLNGVEIERGTPGTYVSMSRTFSDGDRLELSLHATPRMQEYRGEQEIAGTQRAALLYGPLLMAAFGPLDESTRQEPTIARIEPEGGDRSVPWASSIPGSPGVEPTVRLRGTSADVLASLEHDGAATFQVPGQDVHYRPFFTAVDGETYSCFPAFEATS